MSDDPYSQLVGVLKVALPLIALAILSTLFLLSDRIEPGSTIPFAEGEIVDRVQGQQVTAPIFSGVTAQGDTVSFMARQLAQENEDVSAVIDFSARVELAQGGRLAMVSDRGAFRMGDDRAELVGNVLIESSTGYRMRSDLVTARLSEIDINAPDEVRATGPAGDLTAGALRIHALSEQGGVQLLFSQGVKLIYNPKLSE